MNEGYSQRSAEALYSCADTRQYNWQVIDAMENVPRLKMKPQKSLVDASIEWVMQRIQRQIFAAGTRLPSIRALARQRGVSPFTIAKTYARLVAVGILNAILARRRRVYRSAR